MAEPMYRQIAEDLQHRIESGELAGGTQIPTEIDLREHYQASRKASSARRRKAAKAPGQPGPARGQGPG